MDKILNSGLYHKIYGMDLKLAEYSTQVIWAACLPLSFNEKKWWVFNSGVHRPAGAEGPKKGT